MHFDRTEPIRLRGLDRLQALIPRRTPARSGRAPGARSRLLASLALTVFLAACNSETPTPATSRVEAVKATTAAPSAQKWCDVSFSAERAPKLELPPVVPARASSPNTTPPSDRWVWLNLWATWCGPCRQEMPIILRWRDTLQKEGRDVDLWFLSVDEEEATLTSFLEKNPEMAPGNSVRLSTLSDLEPWFKKYSLDSSSAIPINMLVAPGGGIRCVRMGSLHEGDYGTLKALMK